MILLTIAGIIAGISIVAGTTQILHLVTYRRSLSPGSAAQRWQELMQAGLGTGNAGLDARIAGYEQEYVNGTLGLDGLERAVAGALGLRLPDLPCGHPATSGYADGGCNDCDARRAAARAARSSRGVELDRRNELAIPGRDTLGHLTHSVAATSVNVLPHTYVRDAYGMKPVECHELVDATGKVVSRIPKVDRTPLGQSRIVPGA